MQDTNINHLTKALRISFAAHSSVQDKAGQPYFLHALRVAMSSLHPCRNIQDQAFIVGLLHDVVEDTNWTLDDLRARGFSEEIVRGVSAVTRRNGESYMDFIHRAKADKLGRIVKIADLEDNMDITRIPDPTAKDMKRLARYRKAYAIITDEG